LGLFLYQTLDAIDGKQARRTGSSSPLGELFDHGCDAVSTSMLVIIINSFLLIFHDFLSSFCCNFIFCRVKTIK
jgi:ethanolaminephosphotransferase